MSIKIITHGVTLGSITSNTTEGEQTLSTSNKDGAQVLDLETLGPRGGYPMVTIAITSPGSGFIEVPLNCLPPERRRGWSELATGLDNVLAYQIIEESGEHTILFLHVPATTDWMAKLPDDIKLSEISLPGTHESSAIHGYYISQCQTGTLDVQFDDGIRFVDVRVKVNDGDLQTFHGMRPEYSTLREHVDWAESFLREHPSETIIFCIKEEGEHHPEFSARVYSTLKANDNGSLWRIADDVPTLGQVRGKGIVFTRFGKGNDAPVTEWSEGLGLHPSSWPDDRRDGFEIADGCVTGFRCHDWYGVQNISEIPEKAHRVAQFLEPTLTPSNPQPLTVAFNTGATFPFATPQWVSRGIGATSLGLGIEGTNARLTNWLLRKAVEGKRPRAIVLFDYYETNSGLSGVAKLLLALNFL